MEMSAEDVYSKANSSPRTVDVAIISKSCQQPLLLTGDWRKANSSMNANEIRKWKNFPPTELIQDARPSNWIMLRCAMRLSPIIARISRDFNEGILVHFVILLNYGCDLPRGWNNGHLALSHRESTCKQGQVYSWYYCAIKWSTWPDVLWIDQIYII